MKKFVAWGLLLIASVQYADAQIVINSTFNPISYDEMVAPLMAVQRFQNECLQTLDALANETEKVETYLSKEKDPGLWKQYADCYDSIIDAYNDIVRKGTNQRTRGVISDLRRSSSSVRNTIINAYNRRLQLSQDQYNRLNSVKGLACDKFYADISLDEFAGGKTPEVKYSTNNR